MARLCHSAEADDGGGDDGCDTTHEMQLVQHSDAARLSGLTLSQMREWCGRRGIITPDVPPGGRGRHAMYSWQTILTLKILKELREEFGVEIGAWGGAITSCQRQLQHRSFPSLWGLGFVFKSMHEAELASDLLSQRVVSWLYVPLDPHLTVLAGNLALPSGMQLPLFPALKVRS